MSKAVPARGFGPGLPAEGARVVLRVETDRLLVEGWPGLAEVGRQALHVRRQGTGLVVEWSAAAGACALAVEDAAAGAAALAAWLPRAGGGHDAATRRWLWTTLFVVVGLPLLLLGAFFGFRGAIVDAVVARIPVAQERALAEALWDGQRARLALIEGTAANRFVEAVGARLVAAKPSPYSYRFHLADDPGVNAFAMPAGYVVVHRGLIEQAASAEEVAGVLAHEIEHVEQRHSLRGMVQAAGLAALWSLATGDLGGGVAGKWARELAGLHFSREQESSADAGAIDRLVAAGIDPRGLPSFFARLAQAEGALPDALSLLSSHPLSEERAARLEAALESMPRFPPLAEDWAAVRSSLR